MDHHSSTLVLLAYTPRLRVRVVCYCPQPHAWHWVLWAPLSTLIIKYCYHISLGSTLACDLWIHLWSTPCFHASLGSTSACIQIVHSVGTLILVVVPMTIYIPWLPNTQAHSVCSYTACRGFRVSMCDPLDWCHLIHSDTYPDTPPRHWHNEEPN